MITQFFKIKLEPESGADTLVKTSVIREITLDCTRQLLTNPTLLHHCNLIQSKKVNIAFQVVFYVNLLLILVSSY